MVFLNQIYTKSGDAGQTSLGDGSRVPKTHARIAAYGAIDELNAILGVLRTSKLEPKVDDWIFAIQHDLFDLGADLCVPEPTSDEETDPAAHPPLRVTESQTKRLEGWIDEINEPMEPLTSFVLPGGTQNSAWLHMARTICRRAEICVWEIHELTPVNLQALQYLNRLSDLLFVLCQYCNNEGKDSVLWVPGKNRDSGSNEVK
jgi:cob(I)alamin adenosyltransferase